MANETKAFVQPQGALRAFATGVPRPDVGAGNWIGLDDDELCGTAGEWACLEEHHTDWYDAYESACPWAATRPELVELARSAPNGFARGVIYAWLAGRQDVANQTGIAFE